MYYQCHSMKLSLLLSRFRRKYRNKRKEGNNCQQFCLCIRCSFFVCQQNQRKSKILIKKIIKNIYIHTLITWKCNASLCIATNTHLQPPPFPLTSLYLFSILQSNSLFSFEIKMLKKIYVEEESAYFVNKL